MTDLTTDALKRLAGEITPGPWFPHDGDNLLIMAPDGDDDPWEVCQVSPFCGSPVDRTEANARAIALVPALLRKSIEDDATIKAMRALLRAGCDLLAIESEALREGISIGGVMSPGPKDAPTVEAITEIEDWIASVKATLYPTTEGDQP